MTSARASSPTDAAAPSSLRAKEAWARPLPRASLPFGWPGQGYRTLLITTDPAAHLGDVLDTPVGDEISAVEGQPDLWAVKIDAKTAADAYKARILDDARRRGRPESAIAVMEEELNSPCTEEMAAFDKFIEYASQPDWQAVVFDTAPTGHTLRLLELPIDWSRQIDVKVFASVDASAADDVAKQRFGQVIDMMRDPEQSTFAFVMYPEATPILEAWRAARELETVGIHAGLGGGKSCHSARTGDHAFCAGAPRHAGEVPGRDYGTFRPAGRTDSATAARGEGNGHALGAGRATLRGEGRDMSGPVLIQIVGAPIACKEGVKDTWREVAGWAEGQLKVALRGRRTGEILRSVRRRVPARTRGCPAAADHGGGHSGEQRREDFSSRNEACSRGSPARGTMSEV